MIDGLPLTEALFMDAVEQAQRQAQGRPLSIIPSHWFVVWWPIDPEDGACLCDDGCCDPRKNEGRSCWRSGQPIPVGHFKDSAP